MGWLKDLYQDFVRPVPRVTMGLPSPAQAEKIYEDLVKDLRRRGDSELADRMENALGSTGKKIFFEVDADGNIKDDTITIE